MHTPTICIGADGFELSLCSHWMDEGHLPNLARMCERGVHGSVRCRSASSARQWTNHFTGVDADRHGIDGFVRTGVARETKSSDHRELVTTADIDVKTYPELLSEAGRSVGLVNPLPFWPPLDLTDGVCISGMLTPPDAENWVRPESLRSTLDEMGYRIDIQYGNRPRGFIDDSVFEDVDVETLRTDITTVLDRRISCTKFLLEEHELDYMYSLFKSLDLIQHVFWGAMESGHPEYGDCILDAYREIDDLVGWIRERFPESNVIVVSDHGFQSRQTPRSRSIAKLANLVRKRVGYVPLSARKLYEQLNISTSEGRGGMDEISGNHSLPAMWMASGPDIASSESPVVIRFEDVTASLLALLNQPIPTAYQGSPADVVQKTPTYREINLDIDKRTSGRTEEIVTERLHNLGYVDMIDEE